jgi:hypothetical protein
LARPARIPLFLRHHGRVFAPIPIAQGKLTTQMIGIRMRAEQRDKLEKLVPNRGILRAGFPDFLPRSPTFQPIYGFSEVNFQNAAIVLRFFLTLVSLRHYLDQCSSNR